MITGTEWALQIGAGLRNYRSFEPVGGFSTLMTRRAVALKADVVMAETNVVDNCRFQICKYGYHWVEVGVSI